jgi:hypothetical protein
VTSLSATRETIRGAFKAILEDPDVDLGVTVYDREPDPGFDVNSVVIYMITGSNAGSGLGSGEFHESWRVQLSIYSDAPIACGELAVKVSNTILAAAATFKTAYGMKNLKKIVDSDMGRQDPNVHEFQIVQDYSFETDLNPSEDTS